MATTLAQLRPLSLFRLLIFLLVKYCKKKQQKKIRQISKGNIMGCMFLNINLYESRQVIEQGINYLADVRDTNNGMATWTWQLIQ